MSSKYSNINLDSCKLIRDEKEIEGNFTSVVGEYAIPGMEKTGFFKENGCAVYEANNDENARELLASEIMEIIGMPHADIIIAQNEEMKGCLSINVLEKDESFVEVNVLKKGYGFSNNIQDFIQKDSEFMKNIGCASEDFLNQRRKYILKVLYVCALLGNQDIKDDNIKPIINVKTKELRNSPCYDFATSFSQHKQEITEFNITSRDLMIELFKNYYEDIEELAKSTYNNLTKEKIEEIMSDSMFIEIFGTEYNNVKANLGDMCKLNEELYIIKKISELQKQQTKSIKKHGISLEDIKKIYNNVDITSKDNIARMMNYLQSEKESKNNEQC